MKTRNSVLVVCACLTALTAFLISCGPSDRMLEEAQGRIDALKSKGVPDSALSRARVFLYQTRDAKKRGNTGLARRSADSMQILLARAEDLYNDHMAELRPVVDSLTQMLNEEKQEFSGMQAKKIDSMLAIVDSFANMDWLLQAERKAQETVAMLSDLKFDEERAQELRPRIPGTWVCTNRITSKVHRQVNAVEKKIFRFNRDGSVKLIEKKHGQSGPFLKENWEFVSRGSYDLAGDTVVLHVDRFAAKKQDFEELHEEDKKWHKKQHPTYDSTITDGSQDRYITFSDLKRDFVKQ